MTVKNQVVQAHTERPRKMQVAQEELLCARTATHAQQLEECKKPVSLASAKVRAAVPSIAQPRKDGLAQQACTCNKQL